MSGTWFGIYQEVCYRNRFTGLRIQPLKKEKWNRQGFIRKEKEFIRFLGPQDRKSEDVKESSELMNMLHRVLLYWEKSKRDEITTELSVFSIILPTLLDICKDIK